MEFRRVLFRSASDGPQRTDQVYNGEEREFRHYSARGAGLRDAYDDGTIAPTAALGSLVFAPEVVIPAALEMHERYGDFLYSSYGFLDAFNPSFKYDIPLKTGRLVPDKGRSEEHTSELQSLMRISYAVFCLKKKKITNSQ